MHTHQWLHIVDGDRHFHYLIADATCFAKVQFIHRVWNGCQRHLFFAINGIAFDGHVCRQAPSILHRSVGNRKRFAVASGDGELWFCHRKVLIVEGDIADVQRFRACVLNRNVLGVWPTSDGNTPPIHNLFRRSDLWCENGDRAIGGSAVEGIAVGIAQQHFRRERIHIWCPVQFQLKGDHRAVASTDLPVFAEPVHHNVQLAIAGVGTHLQSVGALGERGGSSLITKEFIERNRELHTCDDVGVLHTHSHRHHITRVSLGLRYRHHIPSPSHESSNRCK